MMNPLTAHSLFASPKRWLPLWAALGTPQGGCPWWGVPGDVHGGGRYTGEVHTPGTYPGTYTTIIHTLYTFLIFGSHGMILRSAWSWGRHDRGMILRSGSHPGIDLEVWRSSWDRSWGPQSPQSRQFWHVLTVLDSSGELAPVAPTVLTSLDHGLKECQV